MPETKNCRYCGNSFEATRPDKVTCGARCRQAYKRNFHRLRGTRPVPGETRQLKTLPELLELSPAATRPEPDHEDLVDQPQRKPAPPAEPEKPAAKGKEVKKTLPAAQGKRKPKGKNPRPKPQGKGRSAV